MPCSLRGLAGIDRLSPFRVPAHGLKHAFLAGSDRENQIPVPRLPLTLFRLVRDGSLLDWRDSSDGLPMHGRTGLPCKD